VLRGFGCLRLMYRKLLNSFMLLPIKPCGYSSLLRSRLTIKPVRINPPDPIKVLEKLSVLPQISLQIFSTLRIMIVLGRLMPAIELDMLIAPRYSPEALQEKIVCGELDNVAVPTSAYMEFFAARQHDRRSSASPLLNLSKGRKHCKSGMNGI